MSRSFASSKKSFCKFCCDAGKSESEYSSHCLKDSTGKTVCPVLLRNECKWCFKLGHTTKFCKELAKANKEKERLSKKSSEKKVKKETKVVKKHENIFKSLCKDSDTESETDEGDYPSLKKVKELKELKEELKEVKELKKEKVEVKTGWAAIAAKPKMVAKPIQEPVRTGLVLLSDFIKTDTEPHPLQIKKPEEMKETKKRSWADWSDSEDEDSDFPDEDLMWKNEHIPGMTDDTWDRINGLNDNSW